MEKLTKKQQEVLDYIKSYIVSKGYPPTVREIGKALDISSPTKSLYAIFMEFPTVTLSKNGFITEIIDPNVIGIDTAKININICIFDFFLSSDFWFSSGTILYLL